MSTHNIPFLRSKRKSPYIIPNLQLRVFVPRISRTSSKHGKRAISVRAIEVLLYTALARDHTLQHEMFHTEKVDTDEGGIK